MQYTRKDLGSYRLHCIRTKKFKTIMVRVVFHTPIKKEEITIRNVLCDIFMQSSKKYRSKRELTIKAQDLYAADFQTSNSRMGNYMNTNFYLTVLHDKYTEKGNFQAAVEFLKEIIFEPDIEKNAFDQKKLDIVKTNCKSALEAIKEDASNYSLIRMFEAYDKKSPVSYRMMGYIEDLEKITPQNLYQYYQNMITSNLVDIFVIGDIIEEEIIQIIKQNFVFKTLKKQRVPYLLPNRKPRPRRLFAKETSENVQSRLAIACCCYGLTDYERNYPLTLYNVILGGGNDSKLFREVREKYSLCYDIYSVPNKLDHLLLIRSGIDAKNYKQTVDLIEKVLNEMKKGKFTEENLKAAKEYYNTALEELEESESRIIDNYYMMELLGTDDLEEKRKKMNQVTKEEIIKVAKKIKMDTIFCLEGVKDGNN